MFTRNSSRGFTLVELLVVIAIIGMLVGLLLPAVNAARDAGRRTQNNNNLRNIGVAMLGYNESQGNLPPLRLVLDKESRRKAASNGITYPRLESSVSWAFQLLPYMEQSNIYDRFDDTRPVADPANGVAMRTPIPLYANPRLREPLANCRFPGSDERGTCLDYAANRGFYDRRGGSDTDQYTMKFNPRTVGPFVHNAIVTTAHVRDGTSSTLAIGDRWVGPNDPDEVGLAGASATTIMRGPTGEVGGDGQPIVDAIFPVGVEDPSTDKFGSPRGTASNACFVYLDGHTEWIDYTIDGLVFRAMCTIDGGEVIPQ